MVQNPCSSAMDGVPPLFQVESVVEGQQLISWVTFSSHAASALEDFHYAFYFKKDGIRIGLRKYSTANRAVFPLSGEGSYSVSGFVKHRNSTQCYPSQSSRPMVLSTIRTEKATARIIPSCPPRPGGPVRYEYLYLLPNQSGFGPSADSIVFKPRPDVDAYEVSFPFQWDMDPFQDENWQAQLHMWRLVDFIIIDAEKSSNMRLLHRLMPVIRDWHRHHIAEMKSARFAWQDMMVGLRAMKLTYIISKWQHGIMSLSSADIDCLDQLVKEHLKFLLNPENVRFNNHTISDLVGLRSLAEVVEPETAGQIEQFVDLMFGRLMANQFTAEGVHKENSTGYQKFTVGYMQKIRRSGWFSKYGLNQALDSAQKVLGWFVMPDGRLAPVGDTSGSAPVKSVKRPWFTSRNEVFSSAGYVVVRDDGGGSMRDSSYFFLMGASHTIAHKQADDLSFIWFHGEEILCDPGKYAYTNDKYRRYVVSRVAHNTVTSSGRGDHRLAAGQYGSAIQAIQSHDWGHCISAALEFEKMGYVHERHCLYSVDGWLLVVDRISAASPGDFAQWSHFAPPITDFVACPNGYDAALPSGRALAIRFAASAPCTSELIRGALAPSVQGWISEGYKRVKPGTVLKIGLNGDQRTFATLYAIDDPDCAVQLVDPNMLVVSAKHGTLALSVNLGESGCQVSATPGTLPMPEEEEALAVASAATEKPLVSQ
ncbi:heparinase II/III family protein [Bordetella sp. BOR01]|uniref:heparinase II/III domain-containing protein n=1 Tax=Bordetella sp. BOR01 TaxID=2854779 RepID=UPI001C442C30|nr:heparinase II/III family protein [Bordetella sp. BOR01]MBV7486199.1 heparinase II/III-family protein [Bordetella sp. BOR01]